MEASQKDRWMVVAEAAAYIGISPLTLRKWSNEGVIPVYRTPGGHRRYRQSDLDGVLQKLRGWPFTPQFQR